MSPSSSNLSGQAGTRSRAASGKSLLFVVLDIFWRSSDRRTWGFVIFAAVLLVAAKAATAAIPLLFKTIVDSLTAPGAAVAWAPIVLVGFYGLARMLSQGFNELRDTVFARATIPVVSEVGLRAFKHLHALSLRFHLDRQSGALSHAMEQGVSAIDSTLRLGVLIIGPTLLEVLIVCGVLSLVCGPAFAFIVVGTVVAYLAFTIALSVWRGDLRTGVAHAEREISALYADSLINYETIKYFSSEVTEAANFRRALYARERAVRTILRSSALLTLGQTFIVSAGLVAGMGLAAMQVMEHRLTVGDFVLVNAYFLQLAQPLNLFGFVHRELSQNLMSLSKLNEIFSQDPEINDEPGAQPLSTKGGQVVFRDVEFAYRPRQPVLRNISFELPAGQSLAIVGPSGAGKSTLVRLLYRMFDVTSGDILIDGQDVSAVSQASLRAVIGIVPQDPVLFNRSIAYNIAYGRPGASSAQIADAARSAALHEMIIGLPDGYETLVGERGLKLSGGERQRLALARALLKDPAILVLDEATSALDSRTESVIQTALTRERRKRTTIVIAHRLSTITDVDEILVLADGRINQRGDHETLLRAGGLYEEMWRRQNRVQPTVVPF